MEAESNNVQPALPEWTTHERIAHALHLWRDGTYRLEQIHDPLRRAQYEGAIRFIKALLLRFRTFSELVEVYFPGEGDECDQSEEIGGWVAYTCRVISPQRPLNHGIVEDTAYFRRTQELIEAHSENAQ